MKTIRKCKLKLTEIVKKMSLTIIMIIVHKVNILTSLRTIKRLKQLYCSSKGYTWANKNRDENNRIRNLIQLLSQLTNLNLNKRIQKK